MASKDINFFSLMPENYRWRIIKTLFNAKYRRVFYSKIANKLHNHMPLNKIIEGMAVTAGKKTPGGWEEWMFKQFIIRFQKQPKLSYILNDLIPTMELVLISSGENKPDIFIQSLNTLSEMIERQSIIKKTFISALTKPVIYSLLLIAVLVMLGTNFFPAIEAVMERSFWPESARFLYAMSEFIINDWYIVLIGIGVIAGIIKWSLPNFTPDFRKRLDNYGPWAIYRAVYGASWVLGLGSIIASGRTEMEAVNTILTQSKNNKWLFQRTKAVADKYKNSKNLGMALDTGYDFPDRDFIFNMYDYASLPNFSEILIHEANIWINDAMEIIQRKAKFISIVFLTVFMAVLLMSFVSVFTISDQVVNMAQQQSGV